MVNKHTSGMSFAQNKDYVLNSPCKQELSIFALKYMLNIVFNKLAFLCVLLSINISLFINKHKQISSLNCNIQY